MVDAMHERSTSELLAAFMHRVDNTKHIKAPCGPLRINIQRHILANTGGDLSREYAARVMSVTQLWGMLLVAMSGSV